MAPVVGGRDPLVFRPEQAVQDIKSGDRVFVQGIAATPTLLTKALAERGKQVHRRFTQALDRLPLSHLGTPRFFLLRNLTAV